MAIRERLSIGNLVARAISWASGGVALRETSKGNFDLTLDSDIRDNQTLNINFNDQTITLKYTEDSVTLSGVLVELDAIHLKNNTGNEITALTKVAGGGGTMLAMWDGSVSSSGTGTAANQQLVIYDTDGSDVHTAAGTNLTQV